MNKDKFIKFFNICFYGFVSICCVVMFVCCVYYLVYAERYKDHLRNCSNCPDLPTIQSVSLQPADVGLDTFNSPHIYIPFSTSTVSNNPLSVSRSYLMCFTFILNSTSFSFEGYYPSLANNPVTGVEFVESSVNNFVIGYDTVVYSQLQNISGYLSNRFLIYSYKVDNGFNLDVIKYRTMTSSFPSYNSINSSTVIFYDSNNKTFTFNFALATYSDTLDLSKMLFFTDDTYLLTTSLDDNSAYQQGYADGLSQGLSDSQQDIYNAGFSAGEYQGDSNGYQRGLHEANQFTLLNLAGAVVDAPIQAAMGLLNFNFLGFNLWNLATGILSFAAVVKIVKLVLGGR